MNMKVGEKFRIPKNSFGEWMYAKLLFILSIFFVVATSYIVLCVTSHNAMFQKRKTYSWHFSYTAQNTRMNVW
jgi:hypothetical protein